MLRSIRFRFGSQLRFGNHSASLMILSLLWVGVRSASAQPLPAVEAKPGEAYATAVKSGAWTFFNDPRAIYHRDTQEKTYGGFVDKVGSIGIWSYDHRTAKIDTFTLHPKLQQDDHDNPAFFVRKDGRIAVFYSKHGTENHFYGRVSKKVEDISDFEPERIFTPDDTTKAGISYVHVFRLPAEKDKVFFFNRIVD